MQTPESLGIIDWSRLEEHFRSFRLVREDDGGYVKAIGTSRGGRYAEATVSAPAWQWNSLWRHAK